MSTTVSYKGSTIATVENNTKTLNTQGKYLEADVVLTDVTGGGTAAISIVDTPDSHGGDVRTITALDISDTTAVASDVAQGKYFYTADGTKTVGAREEIIDGDNLGYGLSDRTLPMVGVGQVGYAVI